MIGRKITSIMGISLFIFIFCSIQVLCISNVHGEQGANLANGKSAIEKGDYKKGVALLAKAVDEGTTEVEKYDCRTKTVEYLKTTTDDMLNKDEKEIDYKGILKILEAALDYDCYKNSEILHYQTGTAYRRKGDYKKAIEEYNNALKINEKSYQSRYYMALSYYKKKDYKESYEELGKIPESDPSLGKTAKEKREFLMKNFGSDIIK